MTNAQPAAPSLPRGVVIARVKLALVIAGAVGFALSGAWLAGLDFLEGNGLHALLLRRHKADPVGFETRVATSAARTAHQNPALAGLRFDPRAAVEDLGTAVRIATFFQGSLSAGDGPARTLQSESRMYVYDGGVTLLSVTCLGPGPCTDRADLAQRAERAVLGRRTDTRLDGILPEGGACTSRPAQPGTTRGASLMCLYPSNVTLSVDRKDEAEARRLLDGLLKRG